MFSLQNEPFVMGVAAGTAGILLLLVFWVIYRRRTVVRREINGAIKSVSRAVLQDIIIPDVVDGQIHLDYLLLTPKGLLVLDVKDMPGVVFAGEALDEWTMLGTRERFGFSNPLGPLRAKVASVKSVVKEVPVEGRVAFTTRASFPKGKPETVVSLPQLVEEFGLKKGTDKPLDAFQAGWEKVKKVAHR